MKRPLRAEHIAVTNVQNGDESFVRVCVIDEQGGVWDYHAQGKRWTKLPPLPEEIDDGRENDAEKINRIIGRR